MKEDAVREFIRKLPDLNMAPPTVHLQMLNARSKKVKEFLGEKMDDLVIERKIIRPIPNWRERYFNSLENLCLLQHYGHYDFRGKTICREAKAVFATLSPRNVRLATKNFMTDNINFMYALSESDQMELAKQTSRWFGQLHKNKAKGTTFVTIDIDAPAKNILTRVLDYVSSIKIWMVTETSGGHHVILDLSRKEDAAAFYGKNAILQKMRLTENPRVVEIQRDSQEPVPGTFYHRSGSTEPFYVRILQ